MALPLRGTPQFLGAANGEDITLTFDVAPQEGDIAFLYGGRGNSSDAQAWGPITSGYNEIEVIDDTGPKFGLWYKVMGATPDTDVQGEGGGLGTHGSAYAAFVLDGSLVDAAIFDATATNTGQVTAQPNGPAITTATNGAWVCTFSCSSVRDTNHLPVPDGYTEIAGGECTNETDDIGIHGAYIEKATAGTEDPGVWTNWASGTGGGITIAIKPASATVYNQNCDGAVSFVGAMAKTTNRGLTGGLTFAGSPVRTSARALSGAVTFAGANVKSTLRALSGAVTFAGDNARSSVVTKVVDGALTFAGDMVSQSVKSLDGALTFAGGVVRQALKALTGAIAPTGANLINKSVTQVLSGAVSFVGSLANLTTRALSGALTFVGALGRGQSKAVAGALTLDGDMLAEEAEPAEPTAHGRVAFPTKFTEPTDVT